MEAANNYRNARMNVVGREGTRRLPLCISPGHINVQHLCLPSFDYRPKR